MKWRTFDTDPLLISVATYEGDISGSTLHDNWQEAHLHLLNNMRRQLEEAREKLWKSTSMLKTLNSYTPPTDENVL